MQQKCQQYAALTARLPALLQGAEKPGNAAEQVAIARLCHLKQQYAAAARFFSDAFTADPKLAEAVPESIRYDAACAAALAGCGDGKDADQLDDQGRAAWRLQALDWLRQDLAWRGKLLDGSDAQARIRVRNSMRHWQNDSDLAGVRARDALARLPEEERKRWARLWSDVDALLRRASAPR